MVLGRGRLLANPWPETFHIDGNKHLCLWCIFGRRGRPVLPIPQPAAQVNSFCYCCIAVWLCVIYVVTRATRARSAEGVQNITGLWAIRIRCRPHQCFSVSLGASSDHCVLAARKIGNPLALALPPRWSALYVPVSHPRMALFLLHFHSFSCATAKINQFWPQQRLPICIRSAFWQNSTTPAQLVSKHTFVLLSYCKIVPIYSYLCYI